MRRISLLVAAGWLWAAAPAQAGTITIDFDLTGSTVDILGGGVEIPPEGSIPAGSMSLTIQGSAIDSPLAGAAVLSAFDFDIVISGDILGNAITGTIYTSQTGTTAGSLNGALDTVSFASALVLAIDPANDTIDCSGPNCGSIGSFPVVVTTPQIASPLGSYAVSGLATPGAATFGGLLSTAIEGFATDFTFVGTETSRSFVPEPGVATLLGMGLAALAGWRRRTGRAAR